MRWQFNDGGRAASGFKGQTGDCVCRSIAIATGLPYIEVYNKLNQLASTERERYNPRTGRGKRRSHARTGVYKDTYKKLLVSLGWKWTPTMQIGSGCKVHLCGEELPSGILIVSVSKHLTVVVDGVIHDTHDCSRNENRCVYGYWKKGEQ